MYQECKLFTFSENRFVQLYQTEPIVKISVYNKFIVFTLKIGFYYFKFT
jgi:hypothetical protein